MTDMSSVQPLLCHQCQCVFPSRNQLFKHVRNAHTVEALEYQSSMDKIEVNAASKSGCGTAAAETVSEHVCSLSELPAHFIYVLGGRLRGRTLNAVWRFSSARQRWEDCPGGRMLENRGSHGAATVDNVIFVVGGGGLHSNLSSCEKFGGEKWERVAALNVSRHALAVASEGGSVYAVGGWVDGSVCSAAAEVYDCSSARDEWDPMPDLSVARKLHGCVTLHDKLYVFGGSCDEPLWHTNTVEVLDLAALRREQEEQKQIDASIAPLAETGPTQSNGAKVSPARKRKSGGEGAGPGEAVQVQTKEERQRAGITACAEGDTRRSTAADYRPYRGAAAWRLLPTRLPSKGGGASAVAVGDHIFVFLHGKRVLRYDPARDAYTELSALPVEDWHCFDVCAASAGGLQAAEVYVVGGASRGAWAKVAYLYHTQLDTWQQLPSMPQAKRRTACTFLLDTAAC